MIENDLEDLVPERIMMTPEQYDWLESKLAEEPKDLPKLRRMMEKATVWIEPCS